MTNKIAHRGPDDGGVFISRDRKVGLGNRRLAILDLSNKGHMPMTYMGRYHITYNGEIYNFKSEKQKLQKLGYKFKSNSDTEVILALYDKYGKKCLDHLRGMFSFAIYDSYNQTVFLSVGKIGKKPLKYFWDGRNFIFASELKAILTQKEVKKIIDPVSIHHYLTFGFTFAPRTGFQNIYKLPAGHFILIDLKRKTLTKERYWKLDFNNKLILTEEEWVEKIISKLRESVKMRMISDVPLGAFLSGGVDSSMVVALMAQESPNPVKTFTIGFNEKNMDERDWATKVSDMYDTDHEELIVDKASVDLLPGLVKHFEEPFFDPSSLVTYMVSEMARKKVKVILNGDGGDENFAGYDRYFKLNRDNLIDKYRWMLMSLYPNSLNGKVKKLQRGEKFLKKLNLPLAQRFTTYNSIFLNEEKEDLYTLDFKHLMRGINSYQIMDDLFAESGAQDPRDRGLYADISMYLPEDLLVKVDIASMSVGLEGRSPMLDSEFVEMCAQIPYSLKIKGNTSKYILKKAAEKLIPYENVYRKKMGFSVPLKEWFSDGLDDYAKSKLLSPNTKLNQYLQPTKIKELIHSHGKSGDFGPKIWSLLALELWMESYFN